MQIKLSVPELVETIQESVALVSAVALACGISACHVFESVSLAVIWLAVASPSEQKAQYCWPEVTVRAPPQVEGQEAVLIDAAPEDVSLMNVPAPRLTIFPANVPAFGIVVGPTTVVGPTMVVCAPQGAARSKNSSILFILVECRNRSAPACRYTPAHCSRN